MKTISLLLLEDLVRRTQKNILEAEYLNDFSLEILNQKPNSNSWSVLECLEHLNLYGDFYLPEMTKRIKASKHPSEKQFNSGLLGNYFANMMLPGDKMKKMKTFSDKNPSGSTLDKSTIKRFIKQQEELLILLDRAKKVSLNKTKTSISISNFIKLKLGDTFRFVIYHNDRHMAQAKRVFETMSQSELHIKTAEMT